jgi:hypothetical protein
MFERTYSEPSWSQREGWVRVWSNEVSIGVLQGEDAKPKVCLRGDRCSRPLSPLVQRRS